MCASGRRGAKGFGLLEKQVKIRFVVLPAAARFAFAQRPGRYSDLETKSEVKAVRLHARSPSLS